MGEAKLTCKDLIKEYEERSAGTNSVPIKREKSAKKVFITNEKTVDLTEPEPSDEKNETVAERNKSIATSNVVIEDGVEYIIEKIIDKRKRKRKVQYLVKWEGYDEKDNTWEPASSLPKELKQEFEGSRNGNKNDEKLVKSGMKQQTKVTTDLNKNEVADTKKSEDDIVARRSMRGNKKEEKKEDTLPMRKPGPKRKASLKEKSKKAI